MSSVRICCQVSVPLYRHVPPRARRFRSLRRHAGGAGSAAVERREHRARAGVHRRLAQAASASSAAVPAEYPEKEACFGETHIHTAYSFDGGGERPALPSSSGPSTGPR